MPGAQFWGAGAAYVLVARENARVSARIQLIMAAIFIWFFMSNISLVSSFLK